MQVILFENLMKLTLQFLTTYLRWTLFDIYWITGFIARHPLQTIKLSSFFFIFELMTSISLIELAKIEHIYHSSSGNYHPLEDTLRMAEKVFTVVKVT